MKCPACGYDLSCIKQRSSNQSRYLHGVIIPVLMQHEHFGGWDKEEVKYLLKEKFLAYEKVKGGKVVKIVPSEADLKTAEYERWCSDIRQWASLPYDQDGLECYIPMPNE